MTRDEIKGKIFEITPDVKFNDVGIITDWIQEKFVEKKKYDTAIKLGGEVAIELDKLQKKVKEVTDKMKEAMGYSEKHDMVTLKNPVGNVEKWNNALLKLLKGE